MKMAKSVKDNSTLHVKVLQIPDVNVRYSLRLNYSGECSSSKSKQTGICVGQLINKVFLK